MGGSHLFQESKKGPPSKKSLRTTELEKKNIGHNFLFKKLELI